MHSINAYSARVLPYQTGTLFAILIPSNPMTAEISPITCVTKKPRLMPASAIASAITFPYPCLLSPSTSKVGIAEALSPAEVAALIVFLLVTG